MDNENLGRTSWSTGRADEVDVVLGESHSGLVVSSVRRRLGVCPIESGGTGGLELAHVSEVGGGAGAVAEEGVQARDKFDVVGGVAEEGCR